MRLQLLEAFWRAAVLWAFLYYIAAEVYIAQIFTGICVVFLLANVLVITKPLSYPINLDNVTESPDEQ